MKILEWSEGPSYNTCTMHMLKHAQAINPRLPENLSPEQIPILLDTFDYVGVTDELPLLCFLLADEFGFPLNPVPHENATHSARVFLPGWFQREIEARSYLDLEL